MTTPPAPSAESIEALRQALRTLVEEICDRLKDEKIPLRHGLELYAKGKEGFHFQ